MYTCESVSWNFMLLTYNWIAASLALFIHKHSDTNANEAKFDRMFRKCKWIIQRRCHLSCKLEFKLSNWGKKECANCATKHTTHNCSYFQVSFGILDNFVVEQGAIQNTNKYSKSSNPVFQSEAKFRRFDRWWKFEKQWNEPPLQMLVPELQLRTHLLNFYMVWKVKRKNCKKIWKIRSKPTSAWTKKTLSWKNKTQSFKRIWSWRKRKNGATFAKRKQQFSSNNMQYVARIASRNFGE